MRKEKELLLEEIQQKIDASTALLVTRYDRLPPNPSWEFRGRLAKSGSLFEVVRKRVFLKAAEKAGIPIDAALLKGHIGVVFVQQADALPAAKTVVQFSDEHQQTLELVCGQIEGKMYGGADVKTLSQLPSLDEMRAELLALLVSPMTQTLAVLEAVMAEPLSIIEQKSEKE